MNSPVTVPGRVCPIQKARVADVPGDQPAPPLDQFGGGAVQSDYDPHADL